MEVPFSVENFALGSLYDDIACAYHLVAMTPWKRAVIISGKKKVTERE